jgi:hypothetical protein
VNATTYYHTGYVAGEIATNAGLIAIGVAEVSAAIKAGQIGVRMLVTADGMTMLAVGDSTVAAAKGAGAIVYGTASFATQPAADSISTEIPLRRNHQKHICQLEISNDILERIARCDLGRLGG